MNENINISDQNFENDFENFLRQRRYESCSDKLALQIVTAAMPRPRQSNMTASGLSGWFSEIITELSSYLYLPKPAYALALMLIIGIGAGTQLGDTLGVGLADFDSSFVYFEGDFDL